MTKLTQLTLSKIKYSGDSIGDDIRIEIDCLNHSLDFNKTIKNKSEARIDKVVGEFFTDQPIFSLPISIRIIERDLVFNDVGKTEGSFIVDTHIETIQRFTAKIEIKEKRNYQSAKKAIFEIVFEANITETVSYLDPAHSQGGWTVVLSGVKKRVSLPDYLTVQLERQTPQRQYFKILEGGKELRGTKASVQIEGSGVRHIKTGIPHTEPAHLSYSISKKILTFRDKTYTARDYQGYQWEKGLYDIEIPDYPHKLGESYLDRAALAEVWFRIGHSGERYLHIGSISLGCMTLTEVERWDELCKILMRARKGDGQSTGTIEVVV